MLTSKKHNDKYTGRSLIEDVYRQHWRRISDQRPPDTEIVIVGKQSSGELPIHDRWWVTKGKALQMGTSFNSLGQSKDSKISVLSDDEAREVEETIDQYLSFSTREHGGEKLQLQLIQL